MYFPTADVEISPFIPPLVAFAISVVTSMGGISGAFLLLPFQMSVLGFTTPAVSATNQLYNIVAIPSGVYRYVMEGRMVWPLAWVIVAGTLPGVLIGAVIRVIYLPDPTHFSIFAGLVLGYMGLRMLRDLRRCAHSETQRGGPGSSSEAGQQFGGRCGKGSGMLCQQGRMRQQDPEAPADAQAAKQMPGPQIVPFGARGRERGGKSDPKQTTQSQAADQSGRRGQPPDDQQNQQNDLAQRLPRVRVVAWSFKQLTYTFFDVEYTIHVPALFSFSAVVGVVGGIYGVGGGAIIAPFLVTYFQQPVYTVAGSSLMATFTTSVAGVCFYQVLGWMLPERAIAPDWGLGLLLGLGGMAGMYLGASLQKYLPAQRIKWMLAIIVLGLGAKYIFFPA